WRSSFYKRIDLIIGLPLDHEHDLAFLLPASQCYPCIPYCYSDCHRYVALWCSLFGNSDYSGGIVRSIKRSGYGLACENPWRRRSERGKHCALCGGELASA